MKKMNPVVHFEMPATNNQKMSEFYANVFGWQTQTMGPEMGNYVVITTSENDESGRPKMPGTINGGFYQKIADKPAQVPNIVIAVDDIKDSIQQVIAAGGKVDGEPQMIPGVGWFVNFFDVEENRVSMLQPVMG